MAHINQHIKKIINANNDNRLAIFIGAGVSKNTKSNTVQLPDWYEIINILKQEIDLIQENDFLKIAQLYYNEFGEHSYYEKIKAFFPDFVEPSEEVHNRIFQLYPHLLITTNWDKLLEKAVYNNNLIYDVIRNDLELVKSTAEKKLIKMHGDFDTHNIVFKESDYLNYENNFPLIENFLKSIFSTHTVLFLGYSYNDIDLKQILNWLNTKSDVYPPRYLVVYDELKSQTDYMKNFGITTLDLKEINNGKYPTLLTEFLKRLNQEGALMADLDFKTAEDAEDAEIINFVYKKLNPLESLNGILIEQIQKTLTNCGFQYTNDGIFLEFYDQELTHDFDREIRAVHKRFFEILDNKKALSTHKKVVNKIFSILYRANIIGLTYKKKFFKVPNDPEMKNKIDKDYEEIHLNFKLISNKIERDDIYEMIHLSYQLFQNQEYEKAYQIIEKCIFESSRQKNYPLLYISIFNRNTLLKFLKSSRSYENIKEIDLSEQFNLLPKDIRKALKPVKDFFDFSFLYSFFTKIVLKSEKIAKQKETVISGGIVYDVNTLESSSKHKNLISFMLKNDILMEVYKEFKKANYFSLKIALDRQIQSSNRTFNKIELFSAIKYLSLEELSDLMDKSLKSESITFSITDENKFWLIKEVLPNIVNSFNELMQKKKYFNEFEGYFQNTLFLLSLTTLNDEAFNTIMTMIEDMLYKIPMTYTLYEIICTFLRKQNKLFGRIINKDINVNIINRIIEKIASKKINRQDLLAIRNRLISLFFRMAQENKIIFENKNLIERLLFEMKTIEFTDMIQISETLLVDLYSISSDSIKQSVKDFLLNIDFSGDKKDKEYYIFKLILSINEISGINDEFKIQIEEYLRDCIKKGTYSTDLTFVYQLLKDEQKKGNFNFQGILKNFKEFLEKTNSLKNIRSQF